MNAYELRNVKLMLETAREKASPGATGTLNPAEAGLPLDSYLARWAADPGAFAPDAVAVYHAQGADYLTGDAALVNAMEGLRELTGLPIRPLPLNADEAGYRRLEREAAAASLREHGII